MAVIEFRDRVKDTTTTTGTGNITLAGSAPTGYRTFNAAFGTSVYFHYTIEGGSEWEVGVGHLSASTTLVRDTVLSSSNSNAAVSFSSGTKNVFATVAAQDFQRLNSNVPKVYRALVTQAGASDPTADVLENTLGGTPTYTYNDVGNYAVGLTAAFTANKTFITMGPPNSPFYIYLDLSGQPDEFQIWTMRGVDDTAVNGALTDTALEILVYP